MHWQKDIFQEHLKQEVIDGKNYQYERDRISGMNVIICTTGRLLQNFEESPGFDTNNLKVLILSEADIMLELGFQGRLKAKMNQLPKKKYTMLFSATVNSLILQISLQNPESIFYMRNCLQTHMNNQKMSHRHQINYNNFILSLQLKKNKESFFLKQCIQLYKLHRRQGNMKNSHIFKFSEKKAATLFITNIASNGLDFSKVDWIIQFNCPDDPSTYVHRVGRTARYIAGGFSILFLLSSELSLLIKIILLDLPISIINYTTKYVGRKTHTYYKKEH